jgi:hypothetical protein
MKAILNFKFHPFVILFFEIAPYIICLVVSYFLFREAILAALRMSEPEKTFLITSGGGYITYRMSRKKVKSIYHKLFRK